MSKLRICLIAVFTSISVIGACIYTYGFGVGDVFNIIDSVANGGGISIPIPGPVSVTWTPGQGISASALGFVHFDRFNGLNFDLGSIPYAGGYISTYTNLANSYGAYGSSYYEDGYYSQAIEESNNQLPEYLSESERMNTEEMGALYAAQEYYSPKLYEILNFKGLAIQGLAEDPNMQGTFEKLQNEYQEILIRLQNNEDVPDQEIEDFRAEWEKYLGTQNNWESRKKMKDFLPQRNEIFSLIRSRKFRESGKQVKILMEELNTTPKCVPGDMLILSISLEYARNNRLADAEKWAEQAINYMGDVSTLTDEEQIKYWDYYGTQFFLKGAYSIAEKLYLKAMKMKEDKELPTDVSESFLARLYQVQGRYDDAQEKWKLLKSQENDEVNLGEQLTNYGIVAFFLGNNIEAEKNLRQAITALETAKANLDGEITDPDRKDMVDNLNKICEKLDPEKNKDQLANNLAAIRDLEEIPDTFISSYLSGCYERLAGIYTMQKRYDEAEKMLEKAEEEKSTILQWEDGYLDSHQVRSGWRGRRVSTVNTWIPGQYSRVEPTEDQKNYNLVSIRGVRAQLCLKKSKDSNEKARAYLKEALGYCNQNVGILQEREDVSSSLQLAEALRTRSEIYHLLRNDVKALEDLEEAEKIAEEKKCHKTLLAELYCKLGELFLDLDLPNKANKKFMAAEEIFNEYRVSPAMLCRLYYGQAKVCFRKGKTDEAIKKLNDAIVESLNVRKTASTDVKLKADIFSEYHNLYETMIQWQYQLGNTNEIFNAMERSRAQGLMDLMAAAKIDELQGVDPVTKQKLLSEYKDAYFELNQEKRILVNLLKTADAAGTSKREEEMMAQIKAQEKIIDDCEDRVVEAKMAIQLASPAINSMVNSQELPSFPVANSFLKKNKITAFEYMLAENGTYLFVYGFDVTPQLYLLEVTENQAQMLNSLDPSLNIEAGPLTEKTISSLFHTSNGTGIIDVLKNPADSGKKAAQKLQILYAILLPEGMGELLENREKGEYALILPDGVLSQLPFETLVTQGGSEGFQGARFLLDNDVTLFYSPSFFFYHTLQSRKQSSYEGILTIGINDYSAYNNMPNDLNRMVATRSVSDYGLMNLPGAEKESDNILNVAKEKKKDVTQLKNATEPEVRNALPKKLEVHCGCHAIVENRYGELFSHLVLIPGYGKEDQKASLDDENFESIDGSFTLKEFCDIRLDGCNLVFLSACDTNVGQNQLGEGTWSLSRGMLVAGVKSVISSNWSVNDDSTSELVTQFFTEIVDTKNNDKKLSYADALKSAKLSLRSNDQIWYHPYYWAPFVVSGDK